MHSTSQGFPYSTLCFSLIPSPRNAWISYLFQNEYYVYTLPGISFMWGSPMDQYLALT